MNMPAGQPVDKAQERHSLSLSCITNGTQKGNLHDAPERLQGAVLVPLEEMVVFNKRLESLNKKALKFGLEPVRVIEAITQRFYRAYEYAGADQDFLSIRLNKLREGQLPPHGEQVVEINRIELDYPIIRLGDWQVIARIEALNDKENLIFAVTRDPQDNTTAEEHRHSGVSCQHCNTKRSRKESYLLRNAADAHYKEVARTCLKDFTGIDPSAVLFMAQLQELLNLSAEFDPESGAGMGRPTSISTEGYLARVAFCIEKSGWVSSTRAREQGLTATFEDAMAVDRWLEDDQELAKKFFSSYERHKTTARQAIDWYAKKTPRDSFDYNVKALLGKEFLSLDRKHLAFTAAGVNGYLRHLSYQVNKSSQTLSKHFGKAGDKQTVQLTVEDVINFGTMHRIIFRDAAGNRITWMTSSQPQELIENNAIGRAFNARFTIKTHEEFRGENTTVVTRLRFDSWC